MNYEEFKAYVSTKCIPEAIYKDTEGREILVITMLEAFNMTRWTNEAKRKPLTTEQIDCLVLDSYWAPSLYPIVRAIERAHGIGGEG
jgi:hypothetical protein